MTPAASGRPCPGVIPRAAEPRRPYPPSAEIDTLRSSGSDVEVVRPGGEFARTIGVNLMDVTLRLPAAEPGLRQGAADAERIRQFWQAP